MLLAVTERLEVPLRERCVLLLAAGDERALLVPLRLDTPAGEVSRFTTLTTFGTAGT